MPSRATWKYLELESIIGIFSNLCSYIVREHVSITYQDWRKVPDDLKGAVWGEVKRQFEYPPDQFDEDLCGAMLWLSQAKHFAT